MRRGAVGILEDYPSLSVHPFFPNIVNFCVNISLPPLPLWFFVLCFNVSYLFLDNQALNSNSLLP